MRTALFAALAALVPTLSLAQSTGGLPALKEEVAAESAARIANDANIAATVAALQTRVAALEEQNAALEAAVAAIQPTPPSLLALAPYLTVDQGAVNDVAGPNVILTGVNFHVRSATNVEDTTPDGLGNVIIGWNNPRVDSIAYHPPRTGSNNLVLGHRHSFTSVGGFVGGSGNFITAPYGSVISGRNNSATGDYSVVVSGLEGVAGTGSFSVALTGFRNFATDGNLALISQGTIGLYGHTAYGLIFNSDFSGAMFRLTPP
jgi:hypothetical protein